MGKRKAEDDEWELHKEEILGLYAKLTLSEVMAIMSDSGFRRTKSQYERHIKKWRSSDLSTTGDIKTNVKKKEWEYISFMLRQREKEGKSTQVLVRGFHITPERIERQAYESVYHKHIPQEQITIPSDVVVFTPPGQPATPSLLQQKDLLYSRFQKIPWHQLTSWMDDLLASSDGTMMGMLPLISLSSPTREPTNPNVSRDSSTSLNLDGQIPVPSICENDSMAGLPMMERVLPAHRALLPGTGAEDVPGLTTTNTQLELLTQLVGLISNAHDDDVLKDRIHELLSDQRNLRFLNRLISKEKIATQAFVEKLLMISVGDESRHPPNIALMRALLDSGCDINYEDARGYSLLSRTFYFLKYPGDVPREEYEEIFDELLRRGASWEGLSKPQDLFHDWGRRPSPLDIIVRFGYENTLRISFNSATMRGVSLPVITIGTFIIAAYVGNVNHFRSLATTEPVLQKTLKRSPWLLFEAAASGKNATIMIEYLCRDGFDIMAVDREGRGNPLVFALLSGSDSLNYLLRTGRFIHNYANGEMLRYLWERDVSLERPILNYLVGDHIKAIAPIHAATARRAGADIRLLLDHGANPNQPGAALPVQIAVWRDPEVIDTFLSAGVEFNRTMPHILLPQPRPFETAHRFMPRQTALQRAVIVGRADLFGSLLEAGAELPMPPVCTCGNIEEFGQTQDEDDSDNSEEDSEDKGAYQLLTTASNHLSNNSEMKAVLPEYYGDHVSLCDIFTEDYWNPLLQAAKYGQSEEIFSVLLEKASVGLRSRWLTEQCFAAFMNNFTWGFITQHLRVGTFPVTFSWREETMIEAIREQDEEWIHHFLQDGHLTRDTLQHGFVAAAELGRIQTVQIFLQEGYLPHNSCRMKLPITPSKSGGLYRKRERNEQLYTPLGQVLHNRNVKLRDIMFKHYQDLMRTHECQNGAHFTKVYGIAILYGDIGLVELAKSCPGTSEVVYKGNVYDFEEGMGSFDSPMVSIHSSIQMAVALKQYITVRWLLDHGAHVNVSDETQDDDLAFHSPLQCAAKDGQIAIVRAFLDKDANVNDIPMKWRGATALQFAAMQGNFEMLKLLLQAGAAINAPPCQWEGRTAIEGAAEFGRLDTVSLLLEAGADVQGRWNLNYRRTVYRAWVHGHRALAEMIQQWKREKFGDEDCEQTVSIVDSMDLETLCYSEEDLMEEEFSYYRPCIACTRKFE